MKPERMEHASDDRYKHASFASTHRWKSENQQTRVLPLGEHEEPCRAPIPDSGPCHMPFIPHGGTYARDSRSCPAPTNASNRYPSATRPATRSHLFSLSTMKDCEKSVTRQGAGRLEYFTASILLFPGRHARTGSRAAAAAAVFLAVIVVPADCDVDGCLEDLVHASHLFG